MGFSIFHALGGAAKQYVRDTEIDRERKHQMFTQELEDVYTTATKRIQDRNSSKQELVSLGKQLKNMGIEAGKVEALLDQGPEQAKQFISNAPKYIGALKASGKDINANDLLTLADPEYTGLPTVSEGVDNIMGIYAKSDTKPTKAVQRVAQRLGMEPAEVQAAVTGNYERGAVPSVSYTDDWYTMESIGMQKDIADLAKARSEAIIKGEEAKVSARLFGAEVIAKEQSAMLTVENVIKARNENANWTTIQSRSKKKFDEEMAAFQRDRAKHESSMTKAELDAEEQRIRNEYLERTIKADLAYTRAKTKDVGDKPGVNLKRYQSTFVVSLNAATALTKVGKYLKVVTDDDGNMSMKYIGDEDAREQAGKEMRNVTLQYLKGVFLTEGPQPQALSAAMSMNPFIDDAIVRATGPEQMVKYAYTPFKYKDDDGKMVVGYYDPELDKKVRVSYY